MATFPRHAVLALALMLSLLAGATAAGQAHAAALRKLPASEVRAAQVEAVSQDAVGYLQRKLDELTLRSGPEDALYADAGRWHVGTDQCNRCPLGGAVVAAVLADRVPAQRARYRAIARQTVDRYLATQMPDGGFPSLTEPGKPDGIENEFGGMQVGTIYHLLADQLPKATRTRWAAALQRSADYMISSGMTTWYANGNINLGVTVAIGLAWQATGDPKLQQAYEQSWNFTLHPPARWAAYGLRFARAPKQASWADGAGYLVEAGATPGFDAHYAQMQASIATRAWLMLGDVRAFKLANALTNMLLPRVDAADQLDTGDGSRHPAGGLRFPFITASAAAVGLCRSGLPSADAQFQQVAAWFDHNLDAGSPQNNNAWLFYLGNDVASFAMLADPPSCTTVAQSAAVDRSKRR